MFTLDQLPSGTSLYLSTFAVCLVSGFIPLISAEGWLVVAAVAVPKSAAPLLILLSTLGQMTAKSVLYLAGRGVFRFNLNKYQEKIDRASRKLKEWKTGTYLFIFISSLTGLPPFFIVSLLSGALKLDFKRFFIFGLAGRALRFSVFVLFPELIQGIWN
ncbi:MAG: VTT domain-containing protein [candidate division Zixibacteria bacterium]|nr:VTT domain-containing protein [candidate division Zixibacteria bacterium]